jgi:diguanylate cyclase (GGDEF)-like protein
MSIRNRILLFAVLVTLLPSLGLGWVYFQQAKHTLLENTAHELKIAVSHVKRETLLWLKEQLYEIRVFSSSYLLSDALMDYYRPPAKENGREDGPISDPINDMASYLALVRSQYSQYRKLMVFNNEGQMIAQDPDEGAPVSLPDDWLSQLSTRKMILGDFGAGDTEQDRTLMLGVPVSSANDGLLGILGVEVYPHALLGVMRSVLAASEDRGVNAILSLVAVDGGVLLTTAAPESLIAKGKRNLSAASGRVEQLLTYVRGDGETVVAMLAPVPDYPWMVLMEKRRDALFADIEHTRNLTLLVVLGMVALIGLLAWWLARGIIGPLRELTNAASQVAEDNLDVRIPVRRKDELGFASKVFNDMVGQLKQSRARLELLSTIDSLTQLPNRKSLMEDFSAMLMRYQRHPRAFSLLMIDIDHFKVINDEYGHLGGDDVLRHVASILREQMRQVDVVARYGGEEFIALLDETDSVEAHSVAERIRSTIAASHVSYQGRLIQVTVSIGVAEISELHETREQLIDRADKAMYQAKQQGRNRVVLADAGEEKTGVVIQ